MNITVITNGIPVEVEPEPHTTLRELKTIARKESGCDGKPYGAAEDWEFKNSDGHILEDQKTIERLMHEGIISPLPNNASTMIWLCLKAGHGA